ATLGTDVFLLTMRLRSARPTSVRLRVFADDNSNEITEGSVPSFPGTALASLDPDRNELVVTRMAGDQTIHGLLSSGTISYRVYRLSFPVASTSFTSGVSTYSFDVRSRPASGSRSLTATLGVGLSEDEARGRAEAGARSFGTDPSRALKVVAADWDDFFDALPRLPGAVGPTEQRLYRLAAAALRMNLFVPRGNMTGWGSVPSKAHFNFFFGWDTPLQAIAYAEWSRWKPTWIDQSTFTLGEQMVLLQLASELPNGQICITHDDNMDCPLPITQPPLQAWAAWEVARRDPDRARADRFLAAAYDRLERFFDFWFQSRDADLDGLPEYRVGLEYGWDDTPRYTGRDQEETEAFLPTPPVEPVDLASWLALYAGSMGRISGRLGRPGPAQAWCRRAEGMARRIDGSLWDEARGGWMDRLGATPIDVRTPAMWWPVFTGAVADPAHARRAVEDNLLDPKSFFGRYPIPSVAYDDPLYDHAQGGFYWQGQIWWVPLYASLVALSRTGHERDARALLDRTVSMTARSGGIFEAYDALTGEVGWGATGGAGVEPSAFQFGWSSALLMEALLGRYRSMPGALDCRNEGGTTARFP
ncbi:MAG TPA: trehalase family glycosidase, partial [Actinomycetota bacterium]|nr:trehalase family glycosidase [Actinomycetota bacterium]